MKKKIISVQILHRCKGIPRMTESHQYTWGEVKKILEQEKIVLEDSDTIEIGVDEGGHSHEDAYSDPSYFIRIHRNRLETDKEFKKRVSEFEKIKDEGLKKRKEQYLKLKEEFEGK